MQDSTTTASSSQSGNANGGSRNASSTVAGSLRVQNERNVICASIFDWTASRPTLFRFAAATPMREIAKAYAAERGLDGKNVVLHVYDTQKKKPVQTSLDCTLKDTATRHQCLSLRGEHAVDECRMFAKLKHFPEYTDGGSARFIGSHDYIRLQRRRRSRARARA